MAKPNTDFTAHAPDPNNLFDSALAIPPLDAVFLSSEDQNPNMSDLGFDFNFDDNCDLDFSFDDLDNLYFPSETEHFIIPNNDTQSPGSGSSVVCGGDQVSADVAEFFNFPSGEQFVLGTTSDQQNSDGDREFSAEGPISSHGSGNFGSGVSEAANYPHSPDSSSENFVVEQKVKVEEIGKVSYKVKRKESGDIDGNIMRMSKYRRSENADTVAHSSLSLDENEGINGEDNKRKARLIRNRESAQLSRQRKKHYVEELEDKVRSMHSTIAELNGKISYFMAENTTLRQQLNGANGMCAPTGPMMYPPPPMGYPWVPCAPYMVKQQGSQVPLVPIPKLKPQQPASAPKAKKTETKKKSEGKTKKIASVTFLGLLFFMVLFGGLVPIVNVTFGGIRDGVTGANGFYDQRQGRVLRVDSFSNGTDETTGSDGKCDIGRNCGRGPNGGVDQKEVKSKHSSGPDEFVHAGNASEPLVASLYVPRNDKLVKIDGNLIIHSVLASEKGRAFQQASGKENNSETGLAIPKYPAIGRHPHMYRNPSECSNALSPGASDKLKDHMKSSAADGKMQQWFREGLAGPMLSSGMCTEVFQFDVSSPSAIIPASSVANTSGQRENSTRINNARRRRILRGLPVPLPGSNFTGEQTRGNSQRDNFQGNTSASSVVVSVLVDPREAVDNNMITPKSLSRIFVVVLMDSVKYVTYSCMLPRSGTHLVTT